MLKIYIDRLGEGKVEKLEESLSSSFLNVEEEELSFPGEVELRGSAYLVDDHLILELNVRTVARVPCKICNEPVQLPLQLKSWKHVEPLEGVKKAIFDYTEKLREAILLEAPRFAECNESCPGRETMKSYINERPDEKSHLPFGKIEEI